MNYTKYALERLLLGLKRSKLAKLLEKKFVTSYFRQDPSLTSIYVTHDGGASWSTTSPVPTSATAGTIEFIDAMHGWIVSNTFDVKSNQYINSTVYSTSDGGEHWTHHNVKLSADITMLDFASLTQGWAIDSLQFLYQTSDSGQTWTKVTPTVT